ncbi:MAG: Flp family type IVb pilin [Pseudomonadota bacterium]
MKALVCRFAKCESGATAIEYALLAALIAVALISSMQTVTNGISGTFTKVKDNLS